MYCTGWMSARVKGVMEASPAEGHRRYLLQFVNSSNGMPPPPTPGGPDTAAYDQQVGRDWPSLAEHDSQCVAHES